MDHLRRRRTRPAPDARGLRDDLCRRTDGPGPHARRFPRLQEPALPLGIRRDADLEGALELDGAQRPALRRPALPLPHRLVLVVRRCTAHGVHADGAGLDGGHAAGADHLQPADAVVPDSGDGFLRHQGRVRHRAVPRARAVRLARRVDGIDRQHGPVARDRARHLDGPDQAEDRVHPYRQEPPARWRRGGRARTGARGTPDVDRTGPRDRRDGNQFRLALHRRRVVDGDPVRAGDPLSFRAGRRAGRALLARTSGRGHAGATGTLACGTRRKRRADRSAHRNHVARMDVLVRRTRTGILARHAVRPALGLLEQFGSSFRQRLEPIVFLPAFAGEDAHRADGSNLAKIFRVWLDIPVERDRAMTLGFPRMEPVLSPTHPLGRSWAQCACVLAALMALAIAPLARADTLKVTISGIDKDMAAAVRANLTASQYANRNDVSATQARVFADDAAAQAATALQPYGYYNAEVASDLQHQGSQWTLNLRVTPGPPTRVAKLDLQVPDIALKLAPVRYAVRNFHPKAGEPMVDGTYEGSKGAIASALLETGWLDAKATEHKVAVTRADNRADIHLHYDVGERYKLGEVSFTGSQFAPGFLQRYVPWESGDWYSQSNLLALQQALTDADYFSIVDVEPEVARAKDHVVPVKVEVAPAKRTVYTAGLFVGTDTGPGVRAGIRRRWINRLGHTLDNEVLIAQRLKTAQVVYGIPRPGKDHASFNLGIGYRDENTKTSKSRTFSIAANATRDWHGFVRTLGVHLLSGTFTVGNSRSDVNIPGVERGNSTLIYPEIGLTKKVADNPLFVRNGYSINLIGRAGPGIDTRFAQALADVVWIHALGRRDRLILRGYAGITSVQDFCKLPPQLRFFAGGDRSIRGYAYQAIGPRNSYGLVIGGKRLLVGSATIEHYFTRDWGMAAFVDSGDAFNGSDFHARTGAGVGLRWRSPVGMVRVDVGVPINNPYYHGAQLHIVIGPDL